MSKTLRNLLLVTLPAMMFTSCVNKDYSLTGDIDYTLSNELTLVGPIAHSKIKIYEALPDSFRSFAFGIDGDNVYLMKQDTVHLGNEIKGHLKMYPKGEYEKSIKANPDPSDPKKATSDDIVEYEFGEINTNPNERLDSIMYADGQKLHLKYDSDIDLKYGSKCTIEFDPNVVSLDPDKYPGNKVEFTNLIDMEGDRYIDISRAVFKFNGGNKIRFHFTAELLSKNDPIPTGSSITVAAYFDGLEPRVTWGYLGPDRVIYEATEEIDFSYAKDLQKGGDFFLPFYDPVITFRCINSIGIPATYTLDYVRVRNTYTGEERYADFNGSQSTSFRINYPLISEIKNRSRAALANMDVKVLDKTTNYVCDRQNGHTERLFQIKSDKLDYHYKIQPFLPTTPENVSYFFDDSRMDLVWEAKLPLRFEGDKSNWQQNFYIARDTEGFFDTVAVNFGNIKPSEKLKMTDETAARIKLTHINHLPVDGNGILKWYHTDTIKATGKVVYKEIIPSKRVKLSIPAAPINNQGIVTAETAEGYAYVKFNYEEYMTLAEQGTCMIIQYKVMNQELKDIWFKSNDWIELFAEGWIQGQVTYDLNDNKEEEE